MVAFEWFFECPMLVDTSQSSYQTVDSHLKQSSFGIFLIFTRRILAEGCLRDVFD